MQRKNADMLNSGNIEKNLDFRKKIKEV